MPFRGLLSLPEEVRDMPQRGYATDPTSSGSPLGYPLETVLKAYVVMGANPLGSRWL